MKYAIYCRVSTSEQHTDNQRIRLEEYAKRQGFLFETYVETQSSRKTRPIKANVLNKLRLREYDGVIIWKLDRWARSLQELTLEIEELYKKGISFISLSDNIDLTTATGRLQFQILGAFAEFERNLIRERTLEGLARAKKQGKRLGRPKGKKDSKVRKKSGYLLRYAK
ncbi:recombinase family protein [Candidatus Woesearchaeota archaeon]|nr:recombinase family protein [Candidatus Woesearchaeota archaeon]